MTSSSTRCPNCVAQHSSKYSVLICLLRWKSIDCCDSSEMKSRHQRKARQTLKLSGSSSSRHCLQTYLSATKGSRSIAAVRARYSETFGSISTHRWKPAVAD